MTQIVFVSIFVQHNSLLYIILCTIPSPRQHNKIFSGQTMIYYLFVVVFFLFKDSLYNNAYKKRQTSLRVYFTEAARHQGFIIHFRPNSEFIICAWRFNDRVHVKLKINKSAL